MQSKSHTPILVLFINFIHFHCNRNLTVTIHYKVLRKERDEFAARTIISYCKQKRAFNIAKCLKMATCKLLSLQQNLLVIDKRMKFWSFFTLSSYLLQLDVSGFILEYFNQCNALYSKVSLFIIFTMYGHSCKCVHT
jgi:hypothetical protein